MIKRIFVSGWWVVALIFGLVVAAFWSLIQNSGTHLYDWNDYPLMVWILDQHIDHLSAGSFDSFFQSNAFYPFTNTMLFSDLLLPSSAIGLMISLFTDNRILTQNILFFVAWMLNAVAAREVWKQHYKDWSLLLATLFTALTPFVLFNTGHFQLLNVWPFLFGFSVLIKPKTSIQQAVWLGFWTATAFISSVYLSIFLGYCVVLWWASALFFKNKKINKIKRSLRWIVVYAAVAGILIAPFGYQYIQVRNQYGAQRDYSEYVQYAAGPFDYLSLSGYDSLLSNTHFFKKWNSFIPTSMGGLFPGVVLLGLAAASVVTHNRKRKSSSVGLQVPLQHMWVFFLLLGFSGLIFSLGPRLKIHTQVGPPLPYSLLLKTMPLFEPVRVTARWSLLFYVSLVFFAVQGYQRLVAKKSKKIMQGVALLCMALYLIEVFPLPRKTEARDYYPSIYKHLEDNCNSNQVLLEYPITHNPTGDHRGIVPMLQHWTQIELASTRHNCMIVNGYSGYFPKEYHNYESELSNAIHLGDEDKINVLLRDRSVDFLKVHTGKMTDQEKTTITNWDNKYDSVREQINTDGGIIFEID
jgi:hypothetical protein